MKLFNHFKFIICVLIIQNLTFIYAMDPQPTENTLNPVELNIKKKHSTEHYNYHECPSGEVKTFEAIDGIGFYKIFQKKSKFDPLGEDKLIWETQDKSKLASLVVVKKLQSRNKILKITMYDDTIKFFSKSKHINIWIEQTSQKTSSE